MIAALDKNSTGFTDGARRNRTLRILLLALGIAASLPSIAFGSLITTTFASNNGGAPNWGIFYDLTTFTNDVNITAMDINDDNSGSTGGAVTIDVYTTSGTYVGNETTAGSWTLISTGSGTAATEDSPTSIDLSDFILPASTVTGMFIHHRIGAGPAYTNGTGSNQVYSNGDLRLDLGASISGLFSGDLYTPRVANTTIYYDAIQSSSIPEPSTLLLMGIGLAGVGFVRRRRLNA